MGSTTKNFGFIKPDREDYYDIGDFNTNFDIVDEQLQNERERTAVLEENLYNQNLFINSNFKVSELVNQRNKNEYADPGYCFDMWKFARNLTDGYIDLTGENMRWLFSERGKTGYFNLYQWFENYKAFEGKTITLSIKVRSLTGSGIFRSVIKAETIEGGYNAWFIENDEWQILQRTVTLPEAIDEYLYVNLYVNDNNSDWEIAYAKVEFGEVATKFVDDEPSTKLSKCQRYLYTIGDGTIAGFLPIFAISETAFRGVLQTTLRTIPTVQFIDNGNGQRLYFSGRGTELTNIPTVGHDPKSLFIRFTLDNGIDNYVENMAGYYEVSYGGILLFSAEL